jgi:hypothetical protein
MSDGIYSFLINSCDAIEASSPDGNELRLNCIYCRGHNKISDDQRKLYINTTIGRFHCFRCKESGTIKRLLVDITGNSVDSVDKMLLDYQYKELIKGPSLRDSMLKRFYGKVTEPEENIVSLPKEFIPITEDQQSMEAQLAIRYLLNRGLTAEVIVDYNIGFCAEGRYKNRIIIPCTENNEIIYFINRLYMYDGKLLDSSLEEKAKNDGIEKALNTTRWVRDKKFIGKSQVLFNIDKASNYDSVVVVEGPFDVFGVGEQAVAILGSSISNAQIKKLLYYKFKNIFIMLDEDAYLQSIKEANKFRGLANIYVARIPWPNKDPGNMTFNEFEYVLLNAKPLEYLKKKTFKNVLQRYKKEYE